jgi:peptide/nickel transport system substrate-binding protein
MRSFRKTKRRPRHAQCKTHRANRAGSNGTGGARSWHTLIVGAFLLATGMIAPTAQADTPEGQVTWGIHFTMAPTWFDPAETPGIITPFKVMYAIHDALIKPMPGNAAAPSLAESWTLSPDKLTYEFKLRPGVKFHNGEPLTSEDVKFSFERYRGASQKVLKDSVASVETPDPQRVQFRLKAPWPDFITFYSSATGAGWIVPKKYVEKVGEDGFNKAPIGAGPYKFVSFVPGLELTVEAFEGYWRKTPKIKRLVLKVIPDETTRLAALKRGEVDIVYAINGELARELERTKGLTLKPAVVQGPFWLYFPEQWNEKSPWSDIRVRQAAYHAIDHKTINQALTLGHSRITGSIIPDIFEHYWQPPTPVFDQAKARKLLAEAGYPNGFDAGDYYCDSSWSNLAEAVVNDLQTVGIRIKLRPMERAAFFKAYGEKSLKNIIQGASGAFGNAATRLEAFVVKGGVFSYGSYADIDELFRAQATELDIERRKATLHKAQQLVHDKVMYAPIWQLAFINGVGPRVKESGFGLIPGYPYSGPYEDMTLVGK